MCCSAAKSGFQIVPRGTVELVDALQGLHELVYQKKLIFNRVRIFTLASFQLFL